MNILNFIITNWDSILLVLIIATVLIVFWFRGNKKIVYKILYALVTEAEKSYGGGTGSLKQATVISQVYDKLPAVFKNIVSVTTLEKWVDDAVEKAKEKWFENAKLEKYITNQE